MRASWKIGQIAGIDLYLHVTLVFMLAFFGLSSGGLITLSSLVALFGCVLLHELGHALMARQFGIGTADITLYPIGGVARLNRLPRAPGAELLIALAGPAVNFAIALGLAGLLLAQSTMLGAWAIPGLAQWVQNLLAMNLILALFNLIPAFPMDGGRVLRALLSGRLGRLRATEVAATLGQVLAVAFGVYCLLHLLLPQLFLAGFIFFAASAERNHVRSEEEPRNRDRDDFDQAPPGYLWAYRGNGVWQLSPIPVSGERNARFGPRSRPWL